MRLRLLGVGTRMPAWVTAGFDDYARRLPREAALELVEIPLARRPAKASPADIDRLRRQEGEALLARAGKARIVVLDERGKNWSTRELADRMADWRQDGRDVALLVGGPDGLDAACQQAAEARWSLSRLTLPHPLVRVLLAEQLYRAHSLLAGHPYHRE